MPEGLDEGNWTLARSLPVDDGDSDDDVSHAPNSMIRVLPKLGLIPPKPVDYYEISRWGYSFDILNTSHQLHEEVFFLFWRTCQFIFWEKVALAEFLDRIGEAQKANLRRLVFISELEYSYDWHFTRGQDPWEFCYTKVLDEIPLKHVCDIVLYLKIRENSWNDPTFADRKASAIKSFESFEPLRLLALKETKVILSFPRIISPLIDEQFQAKEKACLEDTLSKRLLDPTLTKVDLVDALSKRIKRLERSEGEAQNYAESSLNQAEESQRSADRYREAAKGWHMIADQKRATIEELEVVLQEAEEVDDQARLVW